MPSQAPHAVVCGNRDVPGADVGVIVPVSSASEYDACRHQYCSVVVPIDYVMGCLQVDLRRGKNELLDNVNLVVVEPDNLTHHMPCRLPP
jgi:hypothetical protein